jgi:2-dehydro-3-deoxyphosphogluconate aldolase/(4S)-4-hydroxy-2-oxoglutarate aldolase
MPWASIMPTGGVSPDEANLKGWFKAGVHCVGMGSQLFPKEVIESGNYQFITQKCNEALAIIQKLKT